MSTSKHFLFRATPSAPTYRENHTDLGCPVGADSTDSAVGAGNIEAADLVSEQSGRGKRWLVSFVAYS